MNKNSNLYRPFFFILIHLLALNQNSICSTKIKKYVFVSKKAEKEVVRQKVLEIFIKQRSKTIALQPLLTFF
jgi:hypothetical protein